MAMNKSASNDYKGDIGSSKPVFKINVCEKLLAIVVESLATVYRRLRFGKPDVDKRLHVDVSNDVIADFLTHGKMERMYFDGVLFKSKWVRNVTDDRETQWLIGRHPSLTFTMIDDCNKRIHIIITDYWSRYFGVIISNPNIVAKSYVI